MRLAKISLATGGAFLALAPLTLTACGSSGEPAAGAATTSATATTTTTASAPAATSSAGLPALAAPPTVVLERFVRYSPDAKAITYDPSRVPVDADVAVVSVQTTSQTLTLLAVRGLPPNQHFGAHVHTNACGQDPAAAGSHFQNKADPKQPSVDPAYANPQNEIWLDFTTDAAGSANAESAVNWTFGNRPHKSIVIHAEHTSTEPGHAGTAGARLACIDI